MIGKKEVGLLVRKNLLVDFDYKALKVIEYEALKFNCESTKVIEIGDFEN